MSVALNARASRNFGRTTQNAGTVIRILTDSLRKLVAKITSLSYTAGATAHTLTFFKAFGVTKLTAAALASQAVIKLAADPGAGTAAGALAANDKLVIEKPDGTLHYAVVQSLSGLDVTLTANVPTGGFAANARVWNYGVSGDGNAPTLNAPSGATTPYTDTLAGVMGGGMPGAPIIVESDNATNQGYIERMSVAYVKEGSN